MLILSVLDIYIYMLFMYIIYIYVLSEYYNIFINVEI